MSLFKFAEKMSFKYGQSPFEEVPKTKRETPDAKFSALDDLRELSEVFVNREILKEQTVEYCLESVAKDPERFIESYIKILRDTIQLKEAGLNEAKMKLEEFIRNHM